MSDPLPSDELNYVPALLEAAKEIRAEGHNGWGNLCQGASEYIVHLRDRVRELEIRMYGHSDIPEPKS